MRRDESVACCAVMPAAVLALVPISVIERTARITAPSRILPVTASPPTAPPSRAPPSGAGAPSRCASASHTADASVAALASTTTAA